MRLTQRVLSLYKGNPEAHSGAPGSPRTAGAPQNLPSTTTPWRDRPRPSRISRVDDVAPGRGRGPGWIASLIAPAAISAAPPSPSATPPRRRACARSSSSTRRAMGPRFGQPPRADVEPRAPDKLRGGIAGRRQCQLHVDGDGWKLMPRINDRLHMGPARSKGREAPDPGEVVSRDDLESGSHHQRQRG